MLKQLGFIILSKCVYLIELSNVSKLCSLDVSQSIKISLCLKLQLLILS